MLLTKACTTASLSSGRAHCNVVSYALDVAVTGHAVVVGLPHASAVVWSREVVQSRLSALAAAAAAAL